MFLCEEAIMVRARRCKLKVEEEKMVGGDTRLRLKIRVMETYGSQLRTRDS